MKTKRETVRFFAHHAKSGFEASLRRVPEVSRRRNPFVEFEELLKPQVGDCYPINMEY
jgi:hypothetical protein